MIGSALALLVRTILYGWVIALWELLKLLCRRRTPPKRPEHRPTQSGCVRIDHPAFVRPDPLIYSQQYLMTQGLAVTWDNPDITLFKGGAPVSSASLDPATTYEVRARIWNKSTEAPVIDMPVHLSFLDFGIGTQSVPVGTVKADVGVLGSPEQPAFATWLWTTPSTPGHYCLQVRLDPADDLNPANNLGQENTDVVAAHSPAEFKFKLRNNTRRIRRYHFEVDAYQIPKLPKCEDAKPDREARLRPHRRALHPVPNGFAVQITPPTPTLNPDESAMITVTVEPPAGFLGMQPINVNAFHEQGFAGGVTLTCVKEV
jgi:hypothetical protein